MITSETVKEVALMQEVYDGVLDYAAFLDDGEPLYFDVPSRPGPVVSALRLADRLLVRRTDFTDLQAPVTRRVGGQMIEIPRLDGQCMVLELGG